MVRAAWAADTNEMACVLLNVTLSVVSFAVYVTLWTVVLVMVKVTTPDDELAPEAAPITEVPEPAVSVTVLPDTGLPPASFNVTVTVVVLDPFAGTEVGLAEMVDRLAEGVPVATVNEEVVPVVRPLDVACSV